VFDGHPEATDTAFPYLLRLLKDRYIYRETPECTLFRLVLRTTAVSRLSLLFISGFTDLVALTKILYLNQLQEGIV
jgi:hypothetical protein